MRVKTLLRAVHGKRLSEAKDWKTAESKFTEALTNLKKVKSAVKGQAAEAQTWIRQVATIADAVSERIGEASAEMIDDRGYSGMHPQVSAIESLQDVCDEIESQTHDALMFLQVITNRVPAEKRGKASGSTKADLQRYLGDAKKTARKARGIVLDAIKALEKADDAAQTALEKLPDDDEARFDRNEVRYSNVTGDGNSNDDPALDEWIEALHGAEISLEYIV